MQKFIIPKGTDCYDKTGVCRHYETKKITKGLITEAYCHFCKKSDEKLNHKEKICCENK